MSSTDERIVKMQFDNATFKQRAAETKQSLKDLDQAVETTGKGKGLFSLSNGMQKVSVTASKMAVITTTALATITNKVVQSGLAMANSLTLDPLKQGFHEYESLLTKQNVIQNATGKSAKVVKGVLNDLNKYSDKTIYSFGNMTDAITKFVNAGVPLKQSVTSIKGIANAAAYAGASSEEANRAMYAFSQSMSLGFIQLQDWNQIENANLGTQKFKNTLLEAGVAAGTLTKKGDEYVTKSGKIISATKGWRDGLHEQWATTEVLNDALGQYADKNTKLGKAAFKSAQEVRTFSAFMDTLKESLGSGWAKIFTTLIGNLGQATNFWTGLSNSVGGSVKHFFRFLNVTLKTFKALGGFQEIAQGFKNLWAPIGAIFTAVGDAWHKAFPDKGPGSGQVLFNIAHGFASITAPLQTVADWIPKLVPVLTVLFKTVKMGASGLHGLAEVIDNIAHALGNLFATKAPAGGGISSFFDKITAGIDKMFQFGVDIAGKIFDGIAAGFTNGSLDTVADIAAAGLVGGIFIAIRKIMKNGLSLDLGGGIASKVGESFDALTGSLKAMQTQIKAKTLMIIAGAIGIMTASIVALSFIDSKKIAKSLGAMAVGFAQLLAVTVVLTKISGATGFIKLPLIAAGLTLLATSILILTGAIALMSTLSWEQIGKGLAGIAAALGVIAGAMKLMPASLPVTAAGLVLVGLALLEITGALAALSLISWENLGKGILAVSTALAGIGLAMKLMPKSLPITAAGLVLVGASLNLIAGAIAIISTLSWESIAKGLVGVSLAIAGIAVAMNLMPVSLPITAAGLVLVGVAINGIAIALKTMGGMSWEEIAKGLVGLAGGLVIIAGALNLMSGTLLGSAALLIAAGAIAVLTPALILLGNMGWEEIAKAMVGLAGALAILGVAILAYSNPAMLIGATAMLIVAPAIVALATAVRILGSLSWEGLAVGLVGLAAALAIIVVAGYALTPVAPTFLAFGAAMFLFGAGLLFASKAIGGFVKSIGGMVSAGTAAIAGFITGLGLGAKKLVDFVTSIFKGIIDLVKALFGIHSPSTVFASIGSNIIAGLMQGLKNAAGAVGKFFSGLFNGALDKVTSIAGNFKSAGTAAIKAVINGLDSIGNNIGKNAVKWIQSAWDWMNGEISRWRSIGVDLVKGIIGGIGDMFGDATSAIGHLASGMIDKAKSVLKIFSPSKVFYAIGKFVVQGMTSGIQNNAAAAISATASMVSGQIAVANEYVSKFIQGLDQQALAARAKADGLAAAAEKAAKAAKMTKGKKDDKAAERLQKQADAASKAADAAEARAEAEKAKQDRAEEFKKASTIDKAKMRSEDAQNQLDAAKAAEARAAAEVAQANALDKQAKAKGVSPAERKRLEKQADDLRKQAAADAKHANDLLAAAKASAADALKYQKQAGDEAAAAFQAAFDADAKAAADEAAFNKLSDADKAAYRRKQAEDLQAKAAKDLNDAKALAYTDLEAANALAQQAMDEADQARQYLDDATQLESNAAQGQGALTGGGGTLGTVVNLDPTDAAAIAMNDYSNLYDMATAAAARDATVQFNQYNTSPEALSPTEVYRQTNNLLTNAVDKLSEATAA